MQTENTTSASSKSQSNHPSKVVDGVKRKLLIAAFAPTKYHASSLNSDFRIGIEKKMVMTGLFLTYEMIFEILSWLPVKSLLRFKCVCKEWCSIIEDPRFIQRHTSQAPYIIGFADCKYAGFIPVKSSPPWGLILEECISTKAYRLRNLATRQILDLPSPCEQKGVCRNMCLIPRSNDLKVVYVDYFEEESDRHRLIYNILRVGNDLTWKCVESPSLCDSRENLPITLVMGTVLYSIKRRLMGEFVIDCLDLENDEIKRSINFTHDLFRDWMMARFINWNGNPSVVGFEKEQLNVLVFENYHKPRRVLIPLTFMKDFPGMSRKNVWPFRVKGNQIFWFFRNEDCIAVFSFDFETKTELEFHACASTETMILCNYRPTICHFKGMRPCTIAGDVEPCDNAKETLVKLTSL